MFVSALAVVEDVNEARGALSEEWEGVRLWMWMSVSVHKGTVEGTAMVVELEVGSLVD